MFYHFEITTMFFKNTSKKGSITLFLKQKREQFSAYKGRFFVLVSEEIFWLVEGFFDKGTVLVAPFKKIGGIYMS